jgi:Mor family transcriptional regulator
MLAEVENKYPEILADFVAKAVERLAARGLERVLAQDIAWELAEMMRKDWGGQGNLYIPKGLDYDLSKRDLEIFRKFNGANYLALAQEYGVTDRQIRSIVNKVREVEFLKRQGSLFD